MATIVQRSTRKVRRLYNDQHVQRLLIGANWAELRLGVLWGFTEGIIPTGVLVTTNSSIFIGVCAGNGGVLDASPVACMGLEIYGTWIQRRTDYAAPGILATGLGDGWGLRGYTKEGVTLARSGAMTGVVNPICATVALDYCTCTIVDINRVTGVITQYHVNLDNSNNNYSVDQLKALMITPTLQVSSAATLTPPENAALMDALNIGSTNEMYPPDFAVVDFRRLS